VTLISFAKYHACVETTTVDVAQLASRLRLGVTRLARRLRREAEAGITPTLLSALSTVEREGPMTIGDLGAAEHVQPPTMTRIVAALVEAGLLERWTDPGDRRVSWVRATPSGARLIARSRSRKDAYLARRLRRLEPQELAVLEEAAGILERLVGEGS
jgi:DNA-binding MarR family transcriptional regulator